MPGRARVHLSQLAAAADRAYRESRYEEAARLYARLVRQLPPGSKEWYRCQLHRAHCLRLAGSFRQAAHLYRMLQRSTDGRAPHAVDALVGEALALRVQGQLRRAYSLLHQALAVYRSRGDTEGIIHTLWAIGTTLRFAGDFRQATAHLLDALRLWRQYRQGSPTYLYCALGGLSRMQGAVQRSLRYYQRAHAYALAEEDTFGIAYSACGIANAHRMLGNWDATHHYFAIARAHYEHIGEQLSYAYTLWGEAMAYLIQQRWHEVAQPLHEAEHIFQRLGDRRGLVYVVLARSQLAFLQTGTVPCALRQQFSTAARWAQRYGYRFEALHLRLVGMLTGIAPQTSLAELKRAYQMCGSVWFRAVPLTPLPVNLP